jgi:GntR family transcriptional regulator, rspAB operon transcriptional repressor
VLLRSLEALFERLILKIRVEGYRTVRGEEALREHAEMMKALRAEDWDRAEQLLRSHIQGARKRLASHLGELAR